MENTPTLSPADQKDVIVESKETPVVAKESPSVTLKSRKNPWMILAIILLLVVLVGGGVFAYMMYGKQSTTPPPDSSASPTPTTSPTSATDAIMTWQTYKNTTFGFSIDYPTTYRMREYPDTKNGAAFSSLDESNEPENETISIAVMPKAGSMVDNPFSDYVKVAATQEIQNYGKQASIKKITTTSGLTGYETTWTVQPLGTGSPYESLPITYFEYPADTSKTIQITLADKSARAIYDQMLPSFKLIPKVEAETQLGTLSGKLCYPSEQLPKGSIVAKDTTTGKTYTQAFAGDKSTFTFEVPVGTYHMVYQAYADPSKPAIYTSGYYTACGVNPEASICNSDANHVHLPAVVEQGKTTTGIALCDFYATPAQQNKLGQSF